MEAIAAMKMMALQPVSRKMVAPVTMVRKNSW